MRYLMRFADAGSIFRPALMTLVMKNSGGTKSESAVAWSVVISNMSPIPGIGSFALSGSPSALTHDTISIDPTGDSNVTTTRCPRIVWPRCENSSQSPMIVLDVTAPSRRSSGA